MPDFHALQIRGGPSANDTTVLLDGVALRGVVSLSFEVRANEITTVTLTLYVEHDLDVDVDLYQQSISRHRLDG